MFEYIGEMGKDYIYAVTPLFEDALMDRYIFQYIFFLSKICISWPPHTAKKQRKKRAWVYKMTSF
jgi:hypothetical protein